MKAATEWAAILVGWLLVGGALVYLAWHFCL